MFAFSQTSHFWLYFAMVAGIVALPGMDMAFVMASSLVDGRRAGASAVAGIVAGGMMHVAMGALGVGLVLLAAPRLFNTLLVAGSLYVGRIGWSLMRRASAFGEVPEAKSRPLWSTFGRALSTSLLNPKAYVFMLAVFPQFLRVEYGSIVAQGIVLGAITSFTQALVYGSVSAGAAGLRGWLRINARAQVLLGRAVGISLLLVAGLTAWQGWRHGVESAPTRLAVPAKSDGNAPRNEAVDGLRGRSHRIVASDLFGQAGATRLAGVSPNAGKTRKTH